MFHVEQLVTQAASTDVDALLGKLDGSPGLWMGCDVASDGLFDRHSVACADAAVRFCLDGPRLLVTPLTRDGGRMVAMLRSWAAFEQGRDGWAVTLDSGRAVLDLLRRFLGAFSPVSPQLALFGAYSFDYYRIGLDDPLPDDGRRRAVLFFPQRVLDVRESDARWIDFRFSVGEEEVPSVGAGALAPVTIDVGEGASPPGAHAGRVAQGVARLREGVLHSLVLSQSLRWRTGTRPVTAFRALRERNPYPGMFFCNLGGGEVLLGASPDLQVRADAEWVEAAPVCGTVRRGADPIDDAAKALGLLASSKENAALALCADAAANDVAEVCKAGTVELRSHQRPHFFSTIIHAVTHVRGRRRPGLDGFDILLAHAMPATVTGLPKAEAVQAIAELEGDWRGWYAGAVARVATDGSVEAYTILRAARVAHGVAETRVGGNLVVDSDPAAEEEETILKAQTLMAVLDGRAAPPFGAGRIGSRYRVRLGGDNERSRARLVDCLARAGADIDDAATLVIQSMGPSSAGNAASGTMAIGEGAIALLAADGANVVDLPAPQFGRAVAGVATPDGFLKAIGAFSAGWYSAVALRPEGLPRGWRVAACSDDGWVLAAQRDDGRACALLFRPDSILSLRDSAGQRAIIAALEWLHGCDMVSRNSKENRK